MIRSRLGRFISCPPPALFVPRRVFLSSSASSEHPDESNLHGPASSRRVRPRYDPTAKRPNKVCDPYGQGGKPMTASEAQSLKNTLHKDWTLLVAATPKQTNNTQQQHQQDAEADADEEMPPIALEREFRHRDFLTGSQFLQKVAAVSLVNNHYPLLQLDRKIVRKQWHTVSRISCQTKVLEGLSANDFFLAMMIDVESNRPEVQSLILSESDGSENKSAEND